MNSLSHGRVVLLGDAGYCPSPASGQGTSLAMVGAYVLAGELAAANGSYRNAFSSYEKLMKGFIDKNQQLGITVLKEMVPKSKKELWVQTTLFSILLKFPWKEKIFKSFVKEMQQVVNEAANAVAIKDYQAAAYHNGEMLLQPQLQL